MPTPSIQTLRADAQQVLNLDSISAVRSVVAATLANANAGTPLNPNLTTQQLWNEFYQIVTQPKSDIESIIANQLMKFLYAPPAPGGAGADKQVIFNDGGVLAGDPQFLWNKTTNLLTVTGSATITGDLTVDTNVLKVNSSANRVGVVTTNLFKPLTVEAGSTAADTINQGLVINSSASFGVGVGTSYSALVFSRNRSIDTASLEDVAQIFGGNSSETTSVGGVLGFSTKSSSNVLTERYRIDNAGIHTWSNVGGGAGTAMTLNATGLGVGTSPSYKLDVSTGGVLNTTARLIGNDQTNVRLRFENTGGGGRIWELVGGFAGSNNRWFSLHDVTGSTTPWGVDDSMNVISNVTGTAPTLSTNSQMVFNLTSNTNLRISVRGSDGVTRTANITLA